MNDLEIPKTDSIQELAHFWDTHDLTDFEDQLEEVREAVFERQAVIRIRLEPEEAEVVKELAKSQGVPHSDLVRQWVLERIHV